MGLYTTFPNGHICFCIITCHIDSQAGLSDYLQKITRHGCVTADGLKCTRVPNKWLFIAQVTPCMVYSSTRSSINSCRGRYTHIQNKKHNSVSGTIFTIIRVLALYFIRQHKKNTPFNNINVNTTKSKYILLPSTSSHSYI